MKANKPIAVVDTEALLIRMRALIVKEFGQVEWQSISIEPIDNKGHTETRVGISFTLCDTDHS